MWPLPGRGDPEVPEAVVGSCRACSSDAASVARRPPAVRLVVSDLHERGRALVEPDVAPVLDRDGVSEPLVRQLVHHRSGGRPEKAGYVGRVWFSRAKPGSQPGGQPTGRREGVVAELRRQPADEPRRLPHQPHRRLRACRGGSCFETATYQGSPCRRPWSTAYDPAAKNARYGTIGSSARQRVVALLAVHRAPEPPPVGDDLLAPGDGDADVHQGLVPRVVVGGEPPGGHVRLVHRHDLRTFASQFRSPPLGDPARVAGVPDPDRRTARPCAIERPGRDPQLVPVRLAEPGRLPVDGDLADRAAGGRG